MKTIVATSELERDFDRELLLRRDLRLVTISSREELTRRLREGADLCFLDCPPSEGDVQSVLREIRQTGALELPPIILVAQSGTPGIDPEEVRRLGFSDLLALPPSPGAISLLVGRHLGMPLRRGERFPVRVHVFEGEGTEPAYLGTTVDLSEVGMLVRARQKFEVGKRLSVRFFLPGRPTELCPDARVVRVAESSSSSLANLALAFERRSEMERSALHDYLKALTADRPFRWKLVHQEGRPRVLLAGTVRSKMELEALGKIEGAVDYHLGDLGRLEAEALEPWIEFIRAVRGTQQICLESCPVWFVRQAARFPDLVEGQRVRSFFAPYVCDPCQLDQDELITVQELNQFWGAPERHCEVCGGTLSLEESSYFSFLDGALHID